MNMKYKIKINTGLNFSLDVSYVIHKCIFNTKEQRLTIVIENVMENIVMVVIVMEMIVMMITVMEMIVTMITNTRLSLLDNIMNQL